MKTPPLTPMLTLRPYTFRDRRVLWLSGSREEIAALAQAIAGLQHDPRSRIPIEEVVKVENPDGLRLYAVSHAPIEIPAGEFHWPCLRTEGIDANLVKLKRLVHARSGDECFDLWPAPAQLLIERATVGH